MKTAPTENLFEFLKKLHNESMRLLATVKFDKRDQQDRLIMSLYMSMIEQAGSIILLIEKLKEAGVSAIFRSMLEAYVDLKNLANDSGYVGHLNAKYHEQWLKLMKEGHDNNNAFLAGLKDVPEFEKRMKSEREKLEALKASGRGPLTIFDKFKKAGVENVYRSYYNMLCADAHNDVRALVDRHLEVNGDDFEVVGYREVTLPDFEPILDSAAGSLMEATDVVHAYSKSGLDEEVKALRAELDAIRKDIVDRG
ncbi:DUF5677 domain-containing protein [Mesorhizobium sp. CC13]|uniref:DUF5677 domain-containing protein n=1 Tax=Mesorhizobium sp. CC13 TaxID=3029194 RepID=UPI0032630533